jgi:hypothetical protein
MDQLHAAGLYPGFEIMGNPGKETPLFAVPFISKMHHFTRQARDKHRESTQKGVVVFP